MKTINEQNASDSHTTEGWEDFLKKSMGPVMESWEGFLKASGMESFDPSSSRGADTIYTNFKMFKKCIDDLGSGSGFDGMKEVFDVTPDIALGFTNTCLQGFLNVMEQGGEWIEKRGKSLSVGDMQELDRELLKKLSQIYEDEFKKYLKLPQLGMGRIYQERALQAFDKLNTLHLTLSEFLHLLYVPIEKSLTSLQKEIIKLAESDGADDRVNTYYKLWISFLEGHYMDLFHQPEYSEAMDKTLWALSEFVQARQSLVNDALKNANIPTNTDFDDLSKEVYLLKKRIRYLERGAS